jgi:CheY-like chemotaxis protein
MNEMFQEHCGRNTQQPALSREELETQAGGKILIVDDTPSQRNLMTAFLEGEDVTAVGTIDEALQALQAGGIGIVISDWHMGGEGEHKIFAESIIRCSVQRGIPVVLRSAPSTDGSKKLEPLLEELGDRVIVHSKSDPSPKNFREAVRRARARFDFLQTREEQFHE